MKKALLLIWGYLTYWLLSTIKVISSAGQTYLGMQQFNDYALATLPNNVRTPLSTAIAAQAVTANVGATLLTTCPSLYEHTMSSKDDAQTNPTDEITFENWRGTIANWILQGTNISQMITNNTFSVYTGMNVLLTQLTQLVRPNQKLSSEEEIAFQIASAIAAALLLQPLVQYNYKKMIQPGCRMFADLVDKGGKFDRHSAKAIAMAIPTMVSIPMLCYYWAKPNIQQLPPAVYNFMGDTGVSIYGAFNATTGLIGSFAMLPLMYDYFKNDRTINPPKTTLTTLLKIATNLFINPDNLFAAGMACYGTICTLQGIHNKIHADHKIDAYHYGPIIAGTVVGLGSLLISSTIGLRIAYNSLITATHPAAQPVVDEQQNLLQDDTNNSYGSINADTSPVIIPIPAARSSSEPMPSPAASPHSLFGAHNLLLSPPVRRSPNSADARDSEISTLSPSK